MQKMISAHELLSPNRFDLGAKILFLEQMKGNIKNCSKIYDAHLRCITENKLVELDNAEKVGLEAYRHEFSKLFRSINDRGFDAMKPVPLSSSGFLFNGAHRTSACIVLNKDIAVQATTAQDHKYNYKYFLERGMTEEQCDAMFSSIVRYRKEIMCAVYWPKAKALNSDIEKQIENIFYIRELDIHPDNRDVFVSHVYKGEPWLGSLEDGYPGASQKAENCFSGSYKIRLVFFIPGEETDLTVIKDEIRNLYGIGKSSIHITDTHSETLEICKTFLNQHTLHLLKYGRPLARPSVRKTLKKLINHKNNDQFIVAGSTILSLYDLRDAVDTDVVPLNSNINDELAQIDVSSYGQHELAHFPESYRTYFLDSSLTIYLYGLRFIPLDTLRKIKKKRNEPKDIEDIRAIDALVGQHVLTRVTDILVSNLKQYFRKSKRMLKRVLVKLKIFDLIYPLYLFFAGRR